MNSKAKDLYEYIEISDERSIPNQVYDYVRTYLFKDKIQIEKYGRYTIQIENYDGYSIRLRFTDNSAFYYSVVDNWYDFEENLLTKEEFPSFIDFLDKNEKYEKYENYLLNKILL